MYRQGDILIKKVKSISEELELVNRDDRERIVLAYGEATGHAHAIHSKKANLFLDKTNNKFYLILKSDVDLVHEEHSTITLPMGNYEVVRQRQYTPERIINVKD